MTQRAPKAVVQLATSNKFYPTLGRSTCDRRTCARSLRRPVIGANILMAELVAQVVQLFEVDLCSQPWRDVQKVGQDKEKTVNDEE